MAGLNTYREAEMTLRRVENEHKQLQFKLFQRLQALDLQVNLIKTSLPSDSQLRLKILAKIGENSSQLSRLMQLKATQSERLSDKLVKQQVNLEQVSHYRSIFKLYEQKMYEMGCNLYSKQVDISVDHIGKREDEKPSLNLVRQFSRDQTQFNNINRFVWEIRKLKMKTQIERLKGQKNIEVENLKKLQKQNSEESTQNDDKKQDQSPQKGKNKDKQPQEVQKQKKKPQNLRRMLMTSSEREKLSTRHIDPTYDHILSLLQLQLKKEQQLKNTYSQLSKQLKQTERLNMIKR